ncbi:MAG TPA: chemotaxis protein CheW [Planctomycetota bacterium]|nr:chemotaxis protein CheW [Planctomycetota bacterium]
MRICTFHLGGMVLALPSDDVQEVIRHDAPTPVPLAPPDVVGLISLRGEMATVVDLARRLGREPPPPAGIGLVLRRERGTLCVRADRAGDVLEADDATFEPPPETLKGAARQLVRGTFKVGPALVLLLDGNRI